MKTKMASRSWPFSDSQLSGFATFSLKTEDNVPRVWLKKLIRVLELPLRLSSRLSKGRRPTMWAAFLIHSHPEGLSREEPEV